MQCRVTGIGRKALHITPDLYDSQASVMKRLCKSEMTGGFFKTVAKFNAFNVFFTSAEYTLHNINGYFTLHLS